MGPKGRAGTPAKQAKAVQDLKYRSEEADFAALAQELSKAVGDGADESVGDETSATASRD